MSQNSATENGALDDAEIVLFARTVLGRGRNGVGLIPDLRDAVIGLLAAHTTARADLAAAQRVITEVQTKADALRQAAEVVILDWEADNEGGEFGDPNIEELRFCANAVRAVTGNPQT